MDPLEKQAKQFSQKLDQYLLAGPLSQQETPEEDTPDLWLSLQLFQTDFSQQSKVKGKLRHHLTLEAGLAHASSSQQLADSASRRKNISVIKKMTRLPVLLVLIFVVGIWSWMQVNSSTPIEASPPHSSPVTGIPVSLATIQQPLQVIPKPLPTPLVFSTTRTSLYSSTTPSVPSLSNGITLTNPATTFP